METQEKTISEQIKDYYDELGIDAAMSDAWKVVEKYDTRTNVSYCTNVTFKIRNFEMTVDYGMGLGCWTNQIKMGGGSITVFNLLVNKIKDIPERQARHKQFYPECYVDTIPQRLVALNVKAWKVFANVCSEGIDAIAYTIDDWCLEFFGNIDSRKGYETHQLCTDRYIRLRQIIGHDAIQKFADLFREL